MNYYFYNEQGYVTTIYRIKPPSEMLKLPHIIATDNLPNKAGYDKIYLVDLITKQLKCEYKKREQTIDEEVKTLRQQVVELNETIDFLIEDSLTRKL